MTTDNLVAKARALGCRRPLVTAALVRLRAEAPDPESRKGKRAALLERVLRKTGDFELGAVRWLAKKS